MTALALFWLYKWKTAEVNVNEANDDNQSGHMWPLM